MIDSQSPLMKHFLYCGARHGETLGALVTRYHFDQSWVLHFFEPNPYVDDRRALSSAENYGAVGIFHRQAVWIEDGATEFQLQHKRRKVGKGSTISALQSTNHRLFGGKKVTVPTIDFSRFVLELQADQIIIRMDIEGAEFPVLRKMLRDHSLSKVRELHIEWHHRHLPAESDQDVENLRKAIQDAMVNVVELK